MDDPAGTVPGDVATHAAGCSRCGGFSHGAWQLRRLARFEVSPAVPDLVPEIMAAVRREAGRPAAPVGEPPAERGGSRVVWRRAVGLAAAVGVVAGFLVTA